MEKISILGCTGSIGESTLDVLRAHPQDYEVFALCAHRQIDKLYSQCLEFKPDFAVLATPASAQQLQQRLRDKNCATTVLHGEQALIDMAEAAEVDIVMAAIVGAAGLHSTLAAAYAGKKILLANKEALVMAGGLFMAAVAQGGATLLPVDSEHNAIFQSLPPGYGAASAAAPTTGDCRQGVRRILLTASGGPFRTTPLADLQRITPEAACAHPNWQMGRKISVDSATMMNKGLELIEAHWLFNMPPDQIEVIIHPQSIIHSLVEYVDGSILAQLGNPDMRTPIAHALAYPRRIASGVEPLDLCQIARLDFSPPDTQRFPCLRLAYEALRAGENAAVSLNASNEVAVAAFLGGELSFLGIAQVNAECLQRLPLQAMPSLAAIMDADAAARQLARKLITEQGR